MFFSPTLLPAYLVKSASPGAMAMHRLHSALSSKTCLPFCPRPPQPVLPDKPHSLHEHACTFTTILANYAHSQQQCVLAVEAQSWHFQPAGSSACVRPHGLLQELEATHPHVLTAKDAGNNGALMSLGGLKKNKQTRPRL